MKKLLLIISFLPFLAAAQTSEEHLRIANEMAKQKKYEDAIKEFTKAIELNNKNIRAYQYRGNAYTNVNDNENAIADFTKVLDAEPKNATVFFYRANAYSNTKDYPDAIKDFNAAFALGYKSADFFHYRANAESNSGDYPTAIADFTTAIQMTPKDAALYEYRGVAKANLKDYKGAVEDYNLSIKLVATNADVYYYKANSEADLADYKDALDDYNTTVKLDPDNAEAIFYRGNTQTNLGDFKDAIVDYQKALSMRPVIANGDLYMAQAASNTNDNALAIEYFTKAIEKDTSKAELYMYRGISENRLCDTPAAMTDFNKAIKIDHKFSKAYQNRADLHITIKQYKPALADADSAVAYDTTRDGYAYVTRAKAKYALQDTLGSIKDFTQALVVNPKNSEAYSGRGEVRSDSMEYTPALVDLDSSVNIYAGNSYAYQVRGIIKSKLGDREGAIHDFRSELQYDPNNVYADLMLSRELIADRQYQNALDFLNKEMPNIQRISKLTPAENNCRVFDTSNYARIIVERGLANGELYKDTAMKADFDKAISIDKSTRSVVYSSMAMFNLRDKDTLSADSNIRMALKIDPNNDQAYFLRAQLRMLKKNYLGAQYDYVAVLMINADDIKTYAYRALSEADHGDTSEMRLDLLRAMKLSPKSSTNFILSGKIKLVQNDYTGAMQDFDKAVALDDQDDMAFFERGVAKLDKGDATGCDDLKKAAGLGLREAGDEVKKRCK